METKKFNNLVSVIKNTACKTCNTYGYRFPFIITKSIFSYLAPLGQQRYPPEHSNLIRIDNEFVSVRGYVGRTEVIIKYKSDVESQKPIAEMQLAAYVESEMHIIISL